MSFFPINSSDDFWPGSAVLARRLGTGVSYFTLALAAVVAGAALTPALAANYDVSTEAELVQAINDANASGDASSTITLTGNVAIANLLPAAAKSLTINTGAFILSASGNGALNAAAGGTLTVNGKTSATDTFSKAGAGTVILSGNGTYSNSLLVNSGTLRIENGAQIIGGRTSGKRLFDVANDQGANASLVISGANSLIDGNIANIAGAKDSTGVVTIEKGGVVKLSSAFTMAKGADSTATLNVTGAGSFFDGTSFVIDTGQGFVKVTDGGMIKSTTVGIGGNLAGVPTVGSGTVLVSGAGSRWEASGNFYMSRGSLSVLDGGLVTAGSMRIASGAGSEASALVSGLGSEIRASNTFDVGASGKGRLTVADGGTVTAQNGTGTIRIATSATGNGTLNIGGETGHAATKAGTVNAAAIQFGAGKGVVNFNHTEASYAFKPQILGVGAVNQVGPGRTVLTSANTYSGPTTISGGTLAAGGLATLSSASAYTVGPNGTLDLAGYDHTLAALTNGGSVRLSNAANTTLTTTGDYVGTGGTLYLSSALGDDSSPTDLLYVQGDTSGTTGIRVTNVGGAGGETTGDGIKIVAVDGNSDAGAFALAGPAIGGAYRYDLFHNGIADPSDGDWYLRSAGLAPTLPVYENYPQVLLGMVDLPTLQQRVGTRYWTALDGAAPAGGATPYAIWARIEGAHGRVKSGSSSSGGARFDNDSALLQVGLDGQLAANASGMWVGGLTAQYGRASADIFSGLGDGSNSTISYGIGATLTWYGENGFYVDGQAQVASLRSNLSAADIGSIGDGIDGSGYALSLEAGRKTALGGGWSLTPQAQLAYAAVDFDRFTDRFGATVSLRKGDSLKGRLGIAADYEPGAGKHVYGIGNLTYEFLDGTAVAVSGVDLAIKPQRFGAELGLGGTYGWAGGKYALHGEALAATSFQGSRSLKGTLGFTMGF